MTGKVNKRLANSIRQINEFILHRSNDWLHLKFCATRGGEILREKQLTLSQKNHKKNGWASDENKL